jgi:hypothetical protein
LLPRISCIFGETAISNAKKDALTVVPKMSYIDKHRLIRKKSNSSGVWCLVFRVLLEINTFMLFC